VDRPRIVLVPTLTELEWRIKPLLEEWADVVSFDVPGVGDEPPAEPMSSSAIVDRGLAQIDRQAWDRCVVVGDEFGTYAAIHLAAARQAIVQGLALGHACLSLSEEGPRAPVNSEVMSAIRQLSKTDYRTYARHLTQVTQGGYDDELAERYIARVPVEVSRGFQTAALEERDKSFEPMLASLGISLLFAKHEGCLAWTDEGWEDAVAAFPDAQTIKTKDKPSVSTDFAEALREFCSGLD
jgi:pimeloyl-ACP methyl ester carboxylesterase